jgi:hypothetical protein
MLIVDAWSEPNPNRYGSIDRRVAMGKISYAIAGSLVFAGLESGAASADAVDVISSPDDSFNTYYSIIPDQSASLDPRLVLVDVSDRT